MTPAEALGFIQQLGNLFTEILLALFQLLALTLQKPLLLLGKFGVFVIVKHVTVQHLVLLLEGCILSQ